MHGKMTNNIVK